MIKDFQIDKIAECMVELQTDEPGAGFLENSDQIHGPWRQNYQEADKC